MIKMCKCSGQTASYQVASCINNLLVKDQGRYYLQALVMFCWALRLIPSVLGSELLGRTGAVLFSPKMRGMGV